MTVYFKSIYIRANSFLSNISSSLPAKPSSSKALFGFPGFHTVLPFFCQNFFNPKIVFQKFYFPCKKQIIILIQYGIQNLRCAVLLVKAKVGRKTYFTSHTLMELKIHKSYFRIRNPSAFPLMVEKHNLLFIQNCFHNISKKEIFVDIPYAKGRIHSEQPIRKPHTLI